MRELAYYEAKFEALDEIMTTDERVHLINGTFLSLSPHRHVYQNLQKKFRERMIAPPISELGFCGLAIVRKHCAVEYDNPSPTTRMSAEPRWPPER